MPYQVKITETIPGTVFELRRTVSPDRIGDDIGAGLADLYTRARQAGLTPTGPPAVTYLDPVIPGRPMKVDLGVAVAPNTGHREIGAGMRVVGRSVRPVARTVHHGGYRTIGAAYQAIDEWISAHGYRSAGPPTETYLTGPDSTLDPTGYRTEVCLPVVPSIGLPVRLAADFAAAVHHTRDALAANGFSVLWETDMRAVLRKKTGADMEDYLILGVCVPDLALRVLDTDRQAGLLLPCTVVVRAADGGTLVEVLDPAVLVRATGLSDLDIVAADLRKKLDSVLEALRGTQR